MRAAMLAAGAALGALLAPLGPAAAQDFTSPAEVRPILAMTKDGWLTLSARPDADLLYFTQIESWRCGIAEIRYSVNSPAADLLRETEPCYRGSAQPNALKLEGHLPYLRFPPGSVRTVTVVLRFEDGTEERIDVRREDILAP